MFIYYIIIIFNSPINALQNRSNSNLFSDSVGSIINVPATGQDIVGAWNPKKKFTKYLIQNNYYYNYKQSYIIYKP